jgi:hypothetical protein
LREKIFTQYRIARVLGRRSQNAYFKVVAVPENWTKRLIHIDVDVDGDEKSDGHYRATGKHPFWTINRGWQHAVNLKAGDKLLTNELSQVAVLDVSEEKTVVDTYNLSVAAVHTFYVVDRGVAVLVHNQRPQYPDFDAVREEAFEFAGLTDPNKIIFTQVDPTTGTVVEFAGAEGGKVGYDTPHTKPGAHHDVPHISAQKPGKRRDCEYFITDKSYTWIVFDTHHNEFIYSDKME